MEIENIRMSFIKGCRIYALGNGILIVTNVESLWNKKIDIWKSVDCGKTWANFGVLGNKDKLEKIIKETNIDNMSDSDVAAVLLDIFDKIKEEMWNEHDKSL